MTVGLVGACYFLLIRPAPVKIAPKAASVSEVAPPAAVASAAPTNALKRPLDRTREVLTQVKPRNGNGEF